MAAGTITIASVDNVDFTASRLRVEMTLTTADDYITDGVTLSFNVNGIDIPTQSPPTDYHIFEDPATGPVSGYAYYFVPGTTLANGVVQMFNGVTQHTQSAMPAATLRAVFYFPNQQ